MQKKFGQNFLTSPDAREKIVALLELTPGNTVWEVGPGLGAMTSSLLSGGAKVTAFELDRGFISLLTGYFADECTDGSFRLVPGDVLKNWKRELDASGDEADCNAGKIRLNAIENVDQMATMALNYIDLFMSILHFQMPSYIIN